MSRYAFNLKPFGSSQKDFYGKAIVIVTRDKYESTERLISYETQVACHDYNFCELNPTISTDSQYIIKASGKPTVSLTNIQ